MSTELIDWLYTNDPDGSVKNGALIVFPRMIDRWNIASFIVSRWEEYKIVIVTDHPVEFMETTTNTMESKWTDLELIPFPLLKYSDIDDIKRALQNTEVDIILFDDTRMLATISPALIFDCMYTQDKSVIQPKIFVLTTWGDTLHQLDIVTNLFPGLRLLKIDLINDIANLDWKISRVHMSNKQLKYYDQVRVRELQDLETWNTTIHDIPRISNIQVLKNFSIPYPITRMLTLYAYPDNIMTDTLVHKYICETDQSSMPDKLTNSTWLNSSYIDNIYDDGPKLLSVLDGIIANWPLKQLVLTRFNNRYGVDLITSFLQLMTQNNKNPYELDEIFHTSCTDIYEHSINTFHKFNNLPSGVFITNIVPLIPLKGISVIHIADSYSFMNIKMVLDRTHKRHLNTQHGQPDLILYSHIATYPNNIGKQDKVLSNGNIVSSDEALHDILASNIKEANRIYTGLISMADSIVFNPTSGISVKNGS
jgi:hypothetical protein